MASSSSLAALPVTAFLGVSKRYSGLSSHNVENVAKAMQFKEKSSKKQ
jgi:hypothetical protein